MIKISVKNISIICVLSFLFFFIVSCGGLFTSPSTQSTEYSQFISANKNKSPSEFIQYWNSTEYKNWQFQLYRDQYTPSSPLIWPDYSTAENIFSSRLINCYRIGKLLEKIFPGENILVSQPDNKWDHYYYKLSTGEIINNYNDGKYLYLK